MADNLSTWQKFSQPPKSALKVIGPGSRISGKSDINPQWRMQAMTEVFGPCGDGWKYEIVRFWTDPGESNSVMVFCQVNVFYRLASGEWSAAIPGVGGNALIANEKKGLRGNDEGYKMALTDALGVAFKALGVAAEVYLGNFDGSKYTNQDHNEPAPQKELISKAQIQEIEDLLGPAGLTKEAFCQKSQIQGLAYLDASRFDGAVKYLKALAVKREEAGA